MKIATLGIIIQDGKLLLGEKKKGEIGTGMLSGPGGKLDPYETIEGCLIRETSEEFEVELDPRSLEKVAYIVFYKGLTPFAFLNKILSIVGCGHTADFGVHVYRAMIASGDIHETADMVPGWYPISNLPFAQMFDSDRHWLPKAVCGEKFDAKVRYWGRAKHFRNVKFFPFRG